MKCPKCGYLGFERAEKCRNCGYDFSLLPSPVPDLDLPLRREEPLAGLDDFQFKTGDTPAPGAVPRAPKTDFDLPPPTPGPSELPLFGAAAASTSAAAAQGPSSPPARPRPAPPPGRAASSDGQPRAAEPAAHLARPPIPPPHAPATQARQDASPPRRAVPAAFDFRDAETGVDTDTVSDGVRPPRRKTTAGTQPAGTIRRALAGLLDTLILGGLDLAVLYFTLRVCHLSFADILVLPLAPLIAFMLALDGGYLVAFTAFGGQTMGKMATSLKVIGEDGRQVEPSQAVVRAAVYLASLLPAGLPFIPGLVGPNRRALHDRVANTRVVQI